ESGDLLLIRREIGAIQQVPPIRERMEQRGIVGTLLAAEGGQVQVRRELGAQEATYVRERRDVETRMDLFRHGGAADDRAALQDHDVQAGLREVGSRDETIVKAGLHVVVLE